MHITLPALIFIVILLTWSPEKISEAGDGLVKLALWLAAAIAVGVALFFCGKFLYAQVLLVWETIAGLGVQGVLWLLGSFVGAGAVVGMLIAVGLRALRGLKTILGGEAANAAPQPLPVKSQPGEGHLFPAALNLTDGEREVLLARLAARGVK